MNLRYLSPGQDSKTLHCLYPFDIIFKASIEIFFSNQAKKRASPVLQKDSNSIVNLTSNITCYTYYITSAAKETYMQQLNFSITINLSLTLKEDKASINIKNVDLIPAVVSLPYRSDSRDRKTSPKSEKRTIHDIILQTAKKYVVDAGHNRFTGAKLFHLSRLNHPGLKRNTFAAQVIAAAPNHPSHRHYPNRKDYFSYLGKGYYKLNQKYLEISENQLLRPSDRVRDHVKRKYIDSAKKSGKKTLSIRAGDIHKELGFSRRIPVVCSALRSRKLSKNCDIELTYIGGPNNSTTTTFTYKLK
jgi:hypothetical protein